MLRSPVDLSFRRAKLPLLSTLSREALPFKFFFDMRRV